MKQILSTFLGVLLVSAFIVQGQVPNLKTIPFSDIRGVSVGNAQDDAAGTGVTVFRLTVPGRAAVEIFGGGPASRETEVIAVERNHPINALVFSGGSAYGLAASGGVVRCLEEHGVGYETGSALVPLVCQSCIYDLGYRSATVRPDEKMGYAACEASLTANNPLSGSVGSGQRRLRNRCHRRKGGRFSAGPESRHRVCRRSDGFPPDRSGSGPQ